MRVARRAECRPLLSGLSRIKRPIESPSPSPIGQSAPRAHIDGDARSSITGRLADTKAAAAAAAAGTVNGEWRRRSSGGPLFGRPEAVFNGRTKSPAGRRRRSGRDLGSRRRRDRREGARRLRAASPIYELNMGFARRRRAAAHAHTEYCPIGRSR